MRPFRYSLDSDDLEVDVREASNEDSRKERPLIASTQNKGYRQSHICMESIKETVQIQERLAGS